MPLRPMQEHIYRGAFEGNSPHEIAQPPLPLPFPGWPPASSPPCSAAGQLCLPGARPAEGEACWKGSGSARVSWVDSGSGPALGGEAAGPGPMAGLPSEQSGSGAPLLPRPGYPHGVAGVRQGFLFGQPSGAHSEAACAWGTGGSWQGCAVLLPASPPPPVAPTHQPPCLLPLSLAVAVGWGQQPKGRETGGGATGGGEDWRGGQPVARQAGDWRWGELAEGG